MDQDEILRRTTADECMVKSVSIGKLKSAEASSSNELKKMAGTTQAIEANLTGMRDERNCSDLPTSSLTRDVSMPNIDDSARNSETCLTAHTALVLAAASLKASASSKSLTSFENEKVLLSENTNSFNLEKSRSINEVSNNTDSSLNKMGSSKDSKKKVKRSALAWVGRTVGK